MAMQAPVGDEERKRRLLDAFAKILDPAILSDVYAAFMSNPQDLATPFAILGLTPGEYQDFVDYVESVAAGAGAPTAASTAASDAETTRFWPSGPFWEGSA